MFPFTPHTTLRLDIVQAVPLYDSFDWIPSLSRYRLLRC